MEIASDKVVFGEKIRSLRKIKKISIAEMAKSIGCTPAAFGNYERGERTPSLKQIKAIAQVLNVSIDELFGCSQQVATDEDTFVLNMSNYTHIEAENLKILI